jgi:cellobiose-specific phosphotransferase system component IIB
MKKIVILTHAPQGTLGDPSSAAKMQRILLDNAKQKGEDVEIEVLVDVKSCPHKEKVHALFQGNQKHQLINGYNAYEGETELKKVLDDADFVVLYPTPHFMTGNTAKLIAASKKPVLSLTEYEFDAAYNRRVKKEFINTVPGTIYLSTGFGRDNIGIYIEKGNADRAQLLDRIHPDDRKKFPEDLNQNNGLYFGYFNRLVHTRNGASPANFIAYAAHENPHIKNIDMVIPLMPQVNSQVAKPNTIDILQSPQFIDNLKTCGKVLLCYSNSGGNEPSRYYVYQQEGAVYTVKELSKDAFEGQQNGADKVIRLLNPFPLNPQSMNALMEASEPVCMFTGDQSVSEGISITKIPFYQAVAWKVKLYDSLIKSTQEFPVLNTWFTLLKNPKLAPEKLASFYRENKTKLHDEMDHFRHYLLDAKDISQNISACIEFIGSLSLPERFNVFLNHLILNQDYFANDGSIEKGSVCITQGALLAHLEHYLVDASDEEFEQILQSLKNNSHKINPNKNPISFEKLLIALKFQYPQFNIKITPEVALKGDLLNCSSWSTDEGELIEGIEFSELIRDLKLLNPMDFNLEQKKQFFNKINDADTVFVNDKVTAQDVSLFLNFLENTTDEENMRQILNVLFTMQTNALEDDVVGPSSKGLFSQLNDVDKRFILNKIESMPMVNQLFITEINPSLNANKEFQSAISSDSIQDVEIADEYDSSVMELIQKQQLLRKSLQAFRIQDEPRETDSMKLG